MKHIDLNSFNPAGKLIANMFILIAALFSSSLFTSLLLLISISGLGICFRGFKIKRLPVLIPFLLFSFSLIWMNGLWGVRQAEEELLKIGWMTFSKNGLELGVMLALRVMIIILAGMVFTMSSPPQELILSLMQQLYLPPGFAYSVLAVLNLSSDISKDRLCLKASHRMRSADGIGLFRSLIPLLAINIRRCENISLAMEARGFNMNGKRTYYRRILWRKRDSLLLGLIIFIIVLIFLATRYMGLPMGYAKWKGYQ